MATLAKALAHPARIAILQHILNSNTCINGDLVKELGLAQATISQHLRELKDIGIIKGEISGQCMNYCIEPSQWEELKMSFSGLFEQLHKGKYDCC